MNSDLSPLCLFHRHADVSLLTHTPFFFSLCLLSFSSFPSLNWPTFCLSFAFGFILLFFLFSFCLSCLSLTNTIWWFGCIRTLHWDPDPSTLQLHSDSEMMGYCSSSSPLACLPALFYFCGFILDLSKCVNIMSVHHYLCLYM